MEFLKFLLLLLLFSFCIGLIPIILRLIKDLIIHFYYKFRYKTNITMTNYINRLILFFMVKNQRPPTSVEIKDLILQYKNNEITEEQLKQVENEHKDLLKMMNKHHLEKIKE